jgi:hypothetical protein
MRIIESFSEFIDGQDFLMESLNRDGYLLILASTDPNNLKNASATPLGISQDTEYSGTLKGAGDMVNIGYKKNFSGKLVKGAGVAPGLDFIEIETGGKKYMIKEAGLLEVPFNRDSELKVRGSGNGLLALGRICQYLYESFNKGFDWGSPFKGTLYIKLQDKKRRGQVYFSNGKIESDNPGRYVGGYTEAMKKFFESFTFGDYESINEDNPKVDILDTFCDTLADAIRAATFIANGEKWKSGWSAYGGFSDMIKLAEKEGIEWDGKTMNEHSNMDKATYLLSITFHYLLDLVSEKLPIDKSKIFSEDLRGMAKKIIIAQGKDLQNFNSASIKSGVEELINFFALNKLPEYPEFTPKLPEYWSHIKAYLTGRVLGEMPRTYKTAMTPTEGFTGLDTSFSSGGGTRTYGSGRLD